MNQCDGCQCGWPTLTTLFGSKIHKGPEGSYANSIICTAERYGPWSSEKFAELDAALSEFEVEEDNND